MKLIIQIPCYNEEQGLARTLSELPRQVNGFDAVEWLVVDDGSRDRTASVARSHGVDHVVTFTKNQGLAKAFLGGLDACLRHGADVIVSTDADNQYRASEIDRLVEPILSRRADFVIGARPIDRIAHFSWIKRWCQRLGSRLVRALSQTPVQDAPSGFRAMSRDAALRLNVFSEYTYTLETIIQAGQKGMAVESVPVQVNPDVRPSRLVKSTPDYIKRSVLTMARIFVVYKPFDFFMTLGTFLMMSGVLVGARFLYFYLSGQGRGHVQSVVLAGVLLGMGLQTILVGFVADLLAVNRKLLEDIQYRLRKLQIGPVGADGRKQPGNANGTPSSP